MKTLRTILELIVMCGLLAVGVMQLQQVDFELAEREKQEDLRLRDYVISHDLEYVKSELIALQKENWKSYAERSRRSWWAFWGVAASLAIYLLVRLMAWRASRKAGGG